MENKTNRKLNCLIFVLTIAIGVVVIIYEGYLKTVLGYKPFIIFGCVIIVLDFYTILCLISTRRLLSLIPVAGVAGYITQVVGTNCNIWVYTNTHRTFYVAIFMFIFASIAMYGLTVKFFALPEQQFSKTVNRLLNVLWISALFFILIITSNKFKTDINLGFWIYYGFLFTFALYSSSRINISVMISLTLAAWVVGFTSEYFGSQAGIWIFQDNGNNVPAYLVGGSWPLEFTLHFCLSRMLAKEMD